MLIITEDQDLFNTINEMWVDNHPSFGPVKAGNEVIDHLQTADFPYDIILIDNTAPTVNEGGSVGGAIELTMQIRAAWPASSVIIITDQDRQPGIAALNAGAFDYIDKSVLEQELPFRVRQIVELQRLREIAQKEPLFEKLDEIHQALAEGKSEDELLTIIVSGVESIGFDRVRLYQLSDDRQHLEARAHLNMPDDFQGVRWPLEKCFYMQKLIQDPRWQIFKREEGSEVPFEDMLLKADVNEWAAVPLLFENQVVGKISVDNGTSKRSLYERDLEQVIPFASKAVEAIRNARKAEMLDRLRQAALLLTEQEDHKALLKQIIDQARALLRAGNSGLCTYDAASGKLRVVADHQHKGRIRRNTIINRETADAQELRRGTSLLLADRRHAAAGAASSEPAPASARLEVMLGSPKQPVGILYVEDLPGREFSKDDQEGLQLFAGYVTSALSRMENLGHLRQLIDTSPMGIIETGRGGIVKRYNEAARAILQYKPEEVINQPVERLYQDPQTPRDIGDRLKKEEKFSNFDTEVRSKSGEVIPIRHAATRVYDSAGQVIGSVGYFQDLRTYKEQERYLELLLEATNVIAREQSLDTGLTRLAELMLSLMGGTFCRILLLNETGEDLIPKAAFLAKRQAQELTSAPILKDPFPVSRYPMLREILAGKDPVVKRFDDVAAQPYLKRLTELFKLDSDLKSLLLLPLKTGDRQIGLLQIGEQRKLNGINYAGSERRSVKPAVHNEEQMLNLAKAIGGQTAVLMQSQEQKERARRKLQSLFKASAALVSSGDPDKIFHEVVEGARLALDACSVSLIEIDEHQRLVDHFTSGEIAFPDIRQIIRPDGNSLKVFNNNTPIVIENIQNESSNFNPDMKKHSNVRAAVCLPVSVQGNRLGVMWVHFDQPRSFDQSDIEDMRLYVNQAALAYDNAKQIHEQRQTRQAVEALAKASMKEDVLKEIVRSACKTLMADSAMVWFFDGQQFVPELSVAEGISDDLWKEFQKLVPSPNGMAATILREGIVEIDDTQDSRELGKNIRALLERIDARRFLGLALKDTEDQMGVLYVNYLKPRAFSQKEREVALDFANTSALILKKARLLESDTLLNLSKALLGTVNIQDIINRATKFAAEALQTEFCNIVLPNDDGALAFRGAVGWPEERIGDIMGKGRLSQTGYTIESRKAVRVDDFATEKRFEIPGIVSGNGISSSMSVPLFRGAEAIGAMLVHTREPRHFKDGEVNLLEAIANQTALAIQGAKHFEDSEKRTAEIEVVLEATKASTMDEVDIKNVLTKIVGQAVECLGSKAILGTLHLYDARSDELTLEAAYPPEQYHHLIDLIGEKRPLKGNERTGHRRGVIGRAIAEGVTQGATHQDEEYVELHPQTRSELAVPFKKNDRVVGVLNLESDKSNAFDADDRRLIEGLAGMASTVIKNAEQQKIVAARTALAYIGLSSSVWFHAISTKAEAILNYLKLTRNDLSNNQAYLPQWLNNIEEVAMRIKEFPRIGMLSPDKDLSLVRLDSFLKERLNQIKEIDKTLNNIETRLVLSPQPASPVRINSTWLKEALNVLIFNAIRAMEETPQKILTICYKQEEGSGIIEINDTGEGIPEEVRKKILDEPIPKSNAKGLGLGLLMARFIIEVYGGDIRVGATGPEGTTMLMRLPLTAAEA